MSVNKVKVRGVVHLSGDLSLITIIIIIKGRKTSPHLIQWSLVCEDSPPRSRLDSVGLGLGVENWRPPLLFSERLLSVSGVAPPPISIASSRVPPMAPGRPQPPPSGAAPRAGKEGKGKRRGGSASTRRAGRRRAWAAGLDWVTRCPRPEVLKGSPPLNRRPSILSVHSVPARSLDRPSPRPSAPAPQFHPRTPPPRLGTASTGARRASGARSAPSDRLRGRTQDGPYRQPRTLWPPVETRRTPREGKRGSRRREAKTRPASRPAHCTLDLSAVDRGRGGR